MVLSVETRCEHFCCPKVGLFVSTVSYNDYSQYNLSEQDSDFKITQTVYPTFSSRLLARLRDLYTWLCFNEYRSNRQRDKVFREERERESNPHTVSQWQHCLPLSPLSYEQRSDSRGADQSQISKEVCPTD